MYGYGMWVVGDEGEFEVVLGVGVYGVVVV